MRTIEYFLSASVAREYSLHFHRFGRIFPELFSSAPSLHKHYSNELIEIERFRSDLAASLSQNPDEVRRVAERWALFLKTRASAMESWSSLATALLAISGISGTLFTLVATSTKAPHAPVTLAAFLLVGVLSLFLKTVVDHRIFWFGFVSAQLEAISKLGPNPSTRTSRLVKMRGLIYFWFVWPPAARTMRR